MNINENEIAQNKYGFIFDPGLRYFKFFAAFFLLAIVIGIVYFNKANCIYWLTKILAMNGWQAVLILSVIFVVTSMLLMPFGLPLNLLAGMLWGTMAGGFLINFLAIIVASVSFYLGRWFGHYFLEGLFEKYASLREMKNTINKYDWQFICLARINPIVPFSVVNYLFGTVPGLSFKHYITATGIANLLPCLAFAAIGSVFKTFALTNASIQHLIFEVGIVLLLISVLFTLKIYDRKGQK